MLTVPKANNIISKNKQKNSYYGLNLTMCQAPYYGSLLHAFPYLSFMTGLHDSFIIPIL